MNKKCTQKPYLTCSSNPPKIGKLSSSFLLLSAHLLQLHSVFPLTLKPIISLCISLSSSFCQFHFSQTMCFPSFTSLRTQKNQQVHLLYSQLSLFLTIQKNENPPFCSSMLPSLLFISFLASASLSQRSWLSLTTCLSLVAC